MPTTKEIDRVVAEVKELTKHIDKRMLAPALACCATENLLDYVTCKHQSCFEPGFEILVKLMVAHSCVLMKERGFELNDGNRRNESPIDLSAFH